MKEKASSAIVQLNSKTIRKFINQRLEQVETILPIQADGFLRASGIYYLCPREEAICHRDNIVRKKEISATQARTFMFGRAFEKALREDILGPSGLLVGKWRCSSCGFIPEVPGMPRYPQPTHCPYCLHTSMEYLEEEIEEKNYMVRGHNDGFLFYNGDPKILEIKTVTEYFWKLVKQAPYSHHVAQVQVYMALLKYKKALIWYYNKNSSCEVLHEIDFDENLARQYLDKGVVLKRYFTSGVVPERTCFNGCEREKTCAVVSQCRLF